jgi:hypothetical protein
MRALLIVLSCLSLLLSLATLALWGRSFWITERVQFAYRGEGCQAWLRLGVAGIDNQPHVASESLKRQRELWLMSRMDGEGGLALVADAPTPAPVPWAYSSFLLPLLGVVLLAVAPVITSARWRLGHKRRRGSLCVCCGYDRRATLDRCPECGTLVPHSGQRTGLARMP